MNDFVLVVVQCEKDDGKDSGLDDGCREFQKSFFGRGRSACSVEKFAQHLLPASATDAETFTQGTNGKNHHYIFVVGRMDNFVENVS